MAFPPSGFCHRRPWWPPMVAVSWAAACLAASGGVGAGMAGEAAAGEPFSAATPLRDQIDAIVAESAVGPSASRCADAEFIRRIHLDLAGVIPTAGQVRDFLADPAIDKRRRLVDTLLEDRGFARHMMFTLDAMLLERATPPGELATAWREYLFTAIAGDRPLDAVARELITADGGDVTTRPAASFVLTRDAEPVRLTRAIGRLFFGRDLQCAQCHDHPLDDDIRQAEHQGLYAFLARTSLFKGKDNTVFVSEKADGEVDYRSVFTQQGEKGVWPRLPGGATLVDEPRPEPAAAYATEPTKTSRGVPTFSRRGALAARLADDPGFRRNLANRIWAIFFGRGIVHPLDAIGPDNPPMHPRLLAVLAEALREREYRLRPIAREIVLSETYQRSIDPPRPETVDLAAIGGLVARLAEDRARVAATIPQLDTAAAAAAARREAVATVARAVHLERMERLAVRDVQSKTAAEAAAAAAKSRAGLDRAREASDPLATAAARSAEAAALLPGDAAVQAVAAAFAAQARGKAAVTAAAAATDAERQAAAAAAQAALDAAREAAAAATARLDTATLAAAERAAAAARCAADEAAQHLRRLDDRLHLARDILAHAALRDADPSAAEIAWQSIVARWTDAGQVAALRGLSPEQLAFSVQQATGALAALHATAAAAIDKQPPEAVVKASDDERSAVRAMQVEMRMVREASAGLRSAAALFGDVMTEGFQASINQALYFGNAPDIQNQLVPSGDNLVAVLVATGDAAAVAEAAYLTVLSRLPTDDERADVAAFLGPRDADRKQAVAEFVWALVSSNEFRFNH